MGGNQIVLGFLSEFSENWLPGVPVTVLDLRCGRGDLSWAIVKWARQKKFDVQILAVDHSQAVIEMARQYHPKCQELVFDVRQLNDPSFLQAQQFDYVICSLGLHHEDDVQAVGFLKMVNRLAKRGVIICDWLRDMRAWAYVSVLSRLWREPAVQHDAPLFVRKGFTPKEVRHLAKKAEVDYLRVRDHFGYRFSLAGERALVLAKEMRPIRGLAGA